jgi:hypothetical protein
MGVIDDVFSGGSQKDAAEATRSYLNLTKSQTMPVIESGYGNSLGFVTNGANGARTALAGGYDTGRGDIGAGYNDAQGFITSGSGAANGYLEGAKGAYNPLAALSTKYGGATNLALDAYGANGADGNTRARDAFEAGPGYGFEVNQGIDAINRRRAAMGMAASGNADRDAIDYVTGKARTAFNDWRTGLAGFTNPELAATSGVATGTAGLGRDQAALSAATGTAQAGLASQRGSMLAQLADRYGTNAANLNMTEGKSLSDLAQAHTGQIMGLNLNIAPQFTKTYKDAADAQTAGSTNAFNLGKEIVTTGVKLASGGFGGGGGAAGGSTFLPSSSFLDHGFDWG